MKELSLQVVIDYPRLNVEKKRQRSTSASFVLAFNNEKVRAGIHRMDVPTMRLTLQPMRCFLQRFDYTAVRCERPQICICGEKNS